MGIQWTYNDIYIYNQQCGDLMSEDGVYHQHGYFFGDNDSNWLGWGSLFSVEPFFFKPSHVNINGTILIPMFVWVIRSYSHIHEPVRNWDAHHAHPRYPSRVNSSPKSGLLDCLFHVKCFSEHERE